VSASQATKGFRRRFDGHADAFGRPEIKQFVQASIDEALKLERAMAQLRTPRRVVGVTTSDCRHGSRRGTRNIPVSWHNTLGEVVDRHGADLVYMVTRIMGN